MFFVSFYISVFFRSWRENGSFKVKNANFGSQNWIGFEKRKSTSKNKRQVCAIVCNNAELKETDILLTKWKLN